MALQLGKTIASLFKGEVLEDIFEGVDKLTTTKEEKLKLKERIARNLQNFQVQMEREITARHESDMQSDSWLSKSVRPMTLYIGLFLFFFFGVLNACYDKHLDNGMVDILATLLSSVVFFYFGSRGIEKVAKIINKPKKESNE